MANPRRDRRPSQKTRLGLQGSSEAARSMIPSGKMQPAVITTASFVGDLWVEVLLLPAGMVCPHVGHRRAISAADRTKTSELSNRGWLRCGIVTTLIQTVKNLKTYPFEDLDRIPEVILPNLGILVQYKTRASGNQRASLVPQPPKLLDGIAMPFDPAKRTMVETVPAIDQLAIGLISNFCRHRSGSDRASLSSRTMSHSLTCGAAVQSPRVFRNRDHELLSIPHTSSTRYTASGWKRAVCRRNSTVCNLPKIQRKRARGRIRCHRG